MFLCSVVCCVCCVGVMCRYVVVIVCVVGFWIMNWLLCWYVCYWLMLLCWLCCLNSFWRYCVSLLVWCGRCWICCWLMRLRYCWCCLLMILISRYWRGCRMLLLSVVVSWVCWMVCWFCVSIWKVIWSVVNGWLFWLVGVSRNWSCGCRCCCWYVEVLSMVLDCGLVIVEGYEKGWFGLLGCFLYFSSVMVGRFVIVVMFY